MNKEQMIYELVKHTEAADYGINRWFNRWLCIEEDEYDAEVKRLSNWVPTLPDWSIAPHYAVWASYVDDYRKWVFIGERNDHLASRMLSSGWIKRH